MRQWYSTFRRHLVTPFHINALAQGCCSLYFRQGNSYLKHRISASRILCDSQSLSLPRRLYNCSLENMQAKKVTQLALLQYSHRSFTKDNFTFNGRHIVLFFPRDYQLEMRAEMYPIVYNCTYKVLMSCKKQCHSIWNLAAQPNIQQIFITWEYLI